MTIFCGRKNWPGACPCSPQDSTNLRSGDEFLDAVVFAVLRDVVIAIRVLGCVRHELKFAIAVAALAANGLIFEQLALGRIDQHTKIVRIADQQIAGVIER